MSNKKKKRRLRVDRVIITAVVMVLLIFGIYKGVSFVIQQFNGSHSTEGEKKEDNSNQNNEKQYIATVIIDPGHGGYDGGSNRDGVYEKNISLTTSKAVAEKLEEANIKAILTRSTDEALGDNKVTDLQKRVDMSAENKAKYFISIHVNDFENRSDISGFEIYTKDENSKQLATSISNQIEKLNYSKNRGLVDGKSLAVLRDNTVPSVLVELGFINNENDFSFLKDDQKLQKIGESIADGIIESINEN